MTVPFVVVFLFVAALAPAGGAPQLETRQLTDGAGRSVRVPAAPGRIVSLAPSITEILFAVGAGDLVVGVTDFCAHPPEAAAKPRIGGLINPDIERIVSLRPDLVLASTAGNYLDDAERIERLGVPVFTIDTPSVASILEALSTVGELAGRRERAALVRRDLAARIDRAKTRPRGPDPPRVLFVIEPDPLIAPGAGTFIGEALSIAGAEVASAGRSARWAQYDMEQVIDMSPDVILTTGAHRAWADRVGSMDEWAAVPAVASGRVFVVSDAIQQPGPRLVDAIEEIAGLLDRLAGGPGQD